MKLVKFLSIGLLAGAIVFTSGCKSWFESSNEEEVTEPMPVPGEDPTFGTGGIDGETPTDLSLPDAPPPSTQKEWRVRTDLNFPTVYFAYDQDSIGTSEIPKVEKVAAYLQEHQQLGLIVEGHCDERGSEEYNRALGERRAISIKNYLINLGVAESRIRTQSFGEDRPAVEGKNSTAYSKNRRAELLPAEMN